MNVQSITSQHICIITKQEITPHKQIKLTHRCIRFGAQSIEHGNVLSEKINFSAPGGRKVAIFGMEDLDPQYFDVSNFSDPPDPPYMSKNANMCYF